ncbi:MAG: SHOCT domain-containing protein [Ruminococcus sp.]|nr:SHOCT domain-containing protein [Ruminococcus sp.]
MEERIIIEGKIDKNYIKNISIVIIFLGILLLLMSLGFCFIRYIEMKSYSEESYFSLLISSLFFSKKIPADIRFPVGISFYLGLVILLIYVCIYSMMSNCSITVTDKRVIGKANFGKRVDLPLSQISAVALGNFSSITVATSSGRINFWCLKNRNEVFNELSNSLKIFQNQNNNYSNSEKNIIQQSSSADELKKFKDLLDTGVITQEEFDAKKKQLLGL